MSAEQPAQRDLLIERLQRAAPAVAAQGALFHQAVADHLGLTLSEVKCLGPLVGGPASVGEIAGRLGLTPGAATRIVDRLTREGYVRREPDPEDGRRVRVVAVPERAAEVAALYEGMAAAWWDVLADCSVEQLAFLDALLARMREVTGLEIARLRLRPRQPGHPGTPEAPGSPPV